MDEWKMRIAEDWPAVETDTRGGWRLGSSYGVTKRANSAVLNGGWAGIWAMVTRSTHRGRGLAGGIITSLLGWAYDKGARRAYLLVAESNTAALRAYERAGFAPLTRYRFRAGVPERP